MCSLVFLSISLRRRRIHVICGGGYMSYAEEDTCYMGTFRPLISPASFVACVICGGGYMSYAEEDTCHMRRRIHVICGGDMSCSLPEEHDTCHMKRRIGVI
jgi:hypothetical protein